MQLHYFYTRRGPQLEGSERRRLSDQPIAQRQLHLRLLAGNREMDQPRHLRSALVVVIVESRGPPEILAAQPPDALDAEVRTRADLLRQPSRRLEDEHAAVAAREGGGRDAVLERRRSPEEERDQLLVAERRGDQAGEVFRRRRSAEEFVRPGVEERESPAVGDQHGGRVAEGIERRDAERGRTPYRDLERVAPAILRSVDERLALGGERFRYGVRLFDLRRESNRIEVPAAGVGVRAGAGEGREEASGWTLHWGPVEDSGTLPPPVASRFRASSSSCRRSASASLVLRSRSESTCTKLHKSFTAMSGSLRMSRKRLSRSTLIALVSSIATTVALRGA